MIPWRIKRPQQRQGDVICRKTSIVNRKPSAQLHCFVAWQEVPKKSRVEASVMGTKMFGGPIYKLPVGSTLVVRRRLGRLGL